MSWPARDLDVISIHAANSDGNAAGTNPKPEIGKDLTILGVDVVSAWISTDPSKPATRSMSGTSVATPVAAGVAALVLEFAMQKDVRDTETTEMLRSMLPLLRHNYGMHSVFRAMGVSTGGFLNIVPWEVLRKDLDDETKGRRQAAFTLRSILHQTFGQLSI